MMLTTDPYVPAIIMKVPITTTKTLQQTIAIHLGDRLIFPLPQLSYSHMQPMGWKHMNVPSKAPISETRLSKTGMALAMM